METRFQASNGAPHEPDSCAIERAYATIRSTCRGSGLSVSDADDVSQEIFLWLLRNQYILDLVTMPWLGAVTRNFVLRHRASRALRFRREGEAVREAPRDCSRAEWAALETRLTLNRLERSLPNLELNVLRQVLEGISFAKAATNEGVPRGSQDWVRRRLVARLANSLRNPRPAMHLRTASRAP
jgi:DNA-directed RNA polymerase specialized sigma24 family protein